MAEIPEMSFDDFYARLIAAGQRVADEGTIELTYRCNLQCLHCYCRAPSLCRPQEELTYQEITRLMDEAADEGCFWWGFTGGEPLLREDFFDLYLYAKRKGFVCAVLTNGTFIDDKAADFFAAWPPRQIEISLYGMTADVHEAVTGVAGSFEATMAAVDRLVRRGVRVEIKTIVMTLNRDQVPLIADFAKGWGAGFRYDPAIHARLDGDKTPHRWRLPASEIGQLDQQMGYLREDWDQMCHFYDGYQPDNQKLFTCGAGRATFHVNPYGVLGTCSFPLSCKYSLRQGSFRKGWREFIPMAVSRQRRCQQYECRDCRLRAVCLLCPNWALLETGDEEKVVDYLCELSRERARRFATGAFVQKEVSHGTQKNVSETADHANQTFRR